MINCCYLKEKYHIKHRMWKISSSAFMVILLKDFTYIPQKIVKAHPKLNGPVGSHN